MLNKMLNKLLAFHFKEVPVGNRIGRLEHDVWHRIRAVSAEAALPWQEKMLLTFAMPRFQLASLSLALVLGVSLGPAIPLSNTVHANQSVPDMSMFTIHASYLPANLIEKSE